jgi:hypothetical protein
VLFDVAQSGVTTIGNPISTASSTILMGRIQFDGYNNAGTRTCAYIVGTSWVIQAGACIP